MFKFDKEKEVIGVTETGRIFVSDDVTRVVPVEQFDAQEFNQNDAGWTRNDLSQLARAQSKSEFDSIMARLNEVKSQSNLPGDISNKDAIKYVAPRYAQSPLELQQFAEYVAGFEQDKIDDAYRKSLEDVKLNPATPVETPVETSKSE